MSWGYGGSQPPYPPPQSAPYSYQQGPPPNQYYSQPPPQQQHMSHHHHHQQGSWQQQPPPPQKGGWGPQYGGPPPPQQGYYGGPPPPQGPYYPPPQQGHAPPPPQQHYGPPPPTPLTLGYDPNFQAQVDTSREADAMRSAMKGMGTNDNELIRVVSGIQDPVIMANLRRTYDQKLRRDLLKDVHSETSGYYREGLEAIVRGPLAQDVYLLHEAMSGAGTKESMLDDILLGRSNADIRAIKHEYHRVYRKTLEAAVKDDLSFKTEKLFDMVLAANRQEESAHVNTPELNDAVHKLHGAMRGVGTDQLTVCSILAYHSNAQVRWLSEQFHRNYRTSLTEAIRKEFSGHMKDALTRMVRIAEDPAKADADSLEEAMHGAGTKDRLLVNRVVRIHWNTDHLRNVKGAYRAHYRGQDLVARVSSETSNHYRDLMIALLNKAGT